MKASLVLLAASISVFAFACSVEGTGSSSGSDGEGGSSGSSGASSSGASGSSGSSSSGSSGTTTSSSSSGGTNLATCGGQVPSGALVTPSLRPSDTAPSPAGGSLADGTYQLASVRVYGNTAQGADRPIYSVLRAKETLELANGQWRIAYHYEGAGRFIDGVHAGDVTVSGTILGGKETCDAGDARNGIGGFLRPFTADGDSIDVFQDEAKEIVFTYVKQ